MGTREFGWRTVQLQFDLAGLGLSVAENGQTVQARFRDGVAGPDPVPAQVGIVEVQLPVPAVGIAYRLRIEPGGPRR